MNIREEHRMKNIADIGNGKRNQMLEEDSAIHNWYQFILGYPPHLVKYYLNEFNIQQGDIVLDPFCGTGTTLVECLKNNIKSIGIEPNPIACFASRVKITITLDPNELRNYLGFILNSSKLSFKHLGIKDDYFIVDEPKTKKHIVLIKSIPGLNEEKWKVVPTGFISKKPLVKVLIIKEVINQIEDTRIKDFFKLSLANLIVKRAGNIAFGPEIGRTAPKEDIEALNYYFSQSNRMIADLEKFKHNDTKAMIINGDSRNLDHYLDNKLLGKINFIITSPPYPNEKDYTRSTRLESVILDFINSKDDVREVKTNLLRSNSRTIYVTDTDGECIKGFDRICKIADEIEKKRLQLKKNSGFEKLYHKIVRHYFGGMYLHLKSLKPYLAKNAKLAYVVGDQMSFFRVYIPTAELLAEVAESLGYRLVKIELWRTRLATVTKQQINENVLVLENL